MVARNVTLQHMGRLADKRDRKPTDPPLLGPNQLQLYSYYKPGLLAGNYRIEAEQNITSEGPHGHESLRVFNRKKLVPEPTNPPPPIEPQDFEVIAPQFSIDPKLVDSYYPPDGHQDEGRVLPHLVLNDPHFPWERKADALIPLLWDADRDGEGAVDETIEMKKRKVNWLDAKGKVTDTEKKAAKRNAVPWVALMVFDPEELAPLTSEDVEPTALNLPFLNGLKLEEQPNNGAIPMTVQQYFAIQPTSRVNFKAGLIQDEDSEQDLAELAKSQEMMTAIFPTKAKFKELFPDIPSLRYSAHVRNVNTTGFPDAGIDQLGLYSIIVSSRVGNYTTDKPITQICHLVSLEHLETTKKGLDNGTGRIALISLFSWTYTALPPDPVNFVDSIKKVVNELQMFRPKDATLTTLLAQANSASDDSTKNGLKALHKRLLTGYSLARWRCETGEETVAFSRGPFVPQKVPPHPKDWATSSNTSKEYQILDIETGIMDLSYSSAWQLGKTLAISDTTFSQALSRLRSIIQRSSQSKTRAEVNSVASKGSLIQAMRNDVRMMGRLTSGDVSEPHRIIIPAKNELAPALENPKVAPVFDKNVAAAVQSAGSAGDEVYTGFNKSGHNNTDWTIIHTWISEKLYLSDIPSHVLIPDPTFLPMESIRFFYVDDIWLDCLIDGALSVGNHLERDDDRIRQSIKQTYNKYLNDNSLGIKPQIPAYGFYLRSQIVKVMPDLKITVKWKVRDDRYPFCRYIRPEDQTILCLLDRPPEELDFIELSQPSHQQRFSFGYAYSATEKSFKFQLRQLFTNGEPDIVEKWGTMALQPSADEIGNWFASSEKEVNGTVPPKRVLNLGRMAPKVNSLIRQNVPSKEQYIDFIANSGELALELNDPSYFFLIKPPGGEGLSRVTERNRQLWCAAVIPATESTTGTSNDKPDDSQPIGGAIPPKVPGSSQPIHPVLPQPPSKASHIVVVKTNPIPVNPSQPLRTGIPQTCFDVRIYADYKGLPPKVTNGIFDPTDYVPTRNEYLYDLIFSVRKLASRFKADYELREIIINIPSTTIKTPAEPLINAGSEGPKVRMLSNQRFVPFLNWTDEYLQVRLVPRSAKEHPVIKINDSRSKEISFRLQEVDVPPIRTIFWVPIKGQPQKQPLGVAKVLVYERYQTPVGVVSAASAPTEVLVVKKDVADVVNYSQ